MIINCILYNIHSLVAKIAATQSPPTGSTEQLRRRAILGSRRRHPRRHMRAHTRVRLASLCFSSAERYQRTAGACGTKRGSSLCEKCRSDVFVTPRLRLTMASFHSLVDSSSILRSKPMSSSSLPRKLHPHPIAWLGESSLADAIRKDDVPAFDVERLVRPEQFAGKLERGLPKP